MGRDERVFAEGDDGTCVYVLASGSVALSTSSAEGGTVVLAILRPTHVFGEMAVIDGEPRVATATAREPTILVSIPSTTFLATIAAQPSVAMFLLQSLSRLVRRVDAVAVDLVLADVPSRVTKFLLGAVDERAVADADGFVPIDLRMSQTELAHLVGGSRQSVNKVLISLESAGVIRRKGSTVVAINAPMLTSGRL